MRNPNHKARTWLLWPLLGAAALSAACASDGAPSPTPTPAECTLTVEIEGQGTVTPPNGSTFTEGSEISLRAEAAWGWVFDHWDGEVSGTENPTSLVMTEDTSVTATFVATENLYVANENADTIVQVVLDPRRTRVVGEGFPGASGLAVDPTTGDLYVSDDSPGVFKVEPSGTVTSVPGPYENPNALAFDSQGRLLVADNNLGQILRLENDQYSALATGFGCPQAIAAQGARVFFATMPGRVYRIDPDDPLPIVYPAPANELTHGPIVERNDGGLVVDGEGRCYVSDLTSRVLRLSPDGSSVTTILDRPGVRPRGLCLSSDESRLWVSDFSGEEVLLVDLASLEVSVVVSRDEDLLHGPFGLVVTTSAIDPFQP
jgi:DNA-binding beta-propeller fold protein YncE